MRGMAFHFTSVSCAALVIGTELNAQETDDPVILDILVLGESKRDVQTGTATPSTLINQEEADDRQAGTIAELVDSVPGVTLVNGSTPAGSGISIRGFGANGTFGTDQKVLIIQDGATLGSQEIYRIGTQLFTDPALYEEVEVIRGTVGSFEYGSGVAGGVVLLNTKDASDFTNGVIGFAGRQTLEFSSNGDGVLSSSILAWQPTEQVELLFNYVYREQDEQTDGDGDIIGNSAFELPSFLLKGKYTFGDDRAQSIEFSYNESTASDRDVPYDTFLTTDDVFGNVDRDTDSRTAILEYAWNPVDNDLINLTVNLSYADQEIEQEYVPGSSVCEPPSGTPPGADGPCGFPFPTGGFGVVNADLRFETTKLTVTNESLFTTGALDHRLRYGIEFSRVDREEADSAPGGRDDRIALFAVNEIQIGDAWTITPALRFETSEITDAIDPDNGPYTNEALIGGVSVRYQFPSGFALFASAAYSESFPIIDDLRNPFTGLPQPDLMTQPEEITTYEIGASFDNTDVFVSGDNLAVKAVAYDIRLDEVTSISGVERVDQQGLELEASYSTQQGYYLDLNANIVDGDERFDDDGTIRTRQYGRLPANDLRLTLGRRFGEELDISWELIANARYHDQTRDPDIDVPGFGVNNLRATYVPQDGLLASTEIRLGIENIFDKSYEPRRSTRPSPGRNVKLTISRTF